MIMSEFYEVGDIIVAVVLKQEYSKPQIVRIVEIPEMNMTPEFFINARQGFPGYKPFSMRRTDNATWNYLEKYKVLVASINDRGGFVTFDDELMKKRGRSMFGKKARYQYARSFPAQAADCCLSAYQLGRS